jgi:hypothetical protein
MSMYRSSGISGANPEGVVRLRTTTSRRWLTVLLQQSNNFIAGDALYLSNTVGVSEDHTDLRT